MCGNESGLLNRPGNDRSTKDQSPMSMSHLEDDRRVLTSREPDLKGDQEALVLWLATREAAGIQPQRGLDPLSLL